MKILHSADWHLDGPLTRQSGDLRDTVNAVPGKLAALVHRHQCDLVLLSGDLFDGTPTKQTVAAFKDALAAMSVPVCISPGNHDFAAPDSVWLTEAFPANVHVFTKPAIESIVLKDLNCRIYGAGYNSMDCPSLLRDFQAGGSERYVLGVLHGDPKIRNSPYCPVTADQVRESGLDYLALGHIHQAGSFRAGSTLCAWPGCPQGRGFDECGQKGAWLVTLEAQAEVQFLPLDGPQFHDLTVTVDTDPMGALESILPPAATADRYRVTLTGECPQTDTAALRSAFSRYPYLELIDKTTPPADLWAAAGDDTLEGIYFQMLRDALDTANETKARQIRLAAKLSRQLMDGREVVL